MSVIEIYRQPSPYCVGLRFAFSRTHRRRRLISRLALTVETGSDDGAPRLTKTCRPAWSSLFHCGKFNLNPASSYFTKGEHRIYLRRAACWEIASQRGHCK
jgi:hypothetical protein